MDSEQVTDLYLHVPVLGGRKRMEADFRRNSATEQLQEMAAAASASMEKLTISLPPPNCNSFDNRKRNHSPSPASPRTASPARLGLYKYSNNRRRPSEDGAILRQRHPSGDDHPHGPKQKHGLFNGLRELTHRMRASSSGSADVELAEDARKSLLKVRARKAAQQLNLEAQDQPPSVRTSVYDLREEDEDSLTEMRPRSYSSDLVIVRKTSRPLTVDVLGSLDHLENPYMQYLNLLNCYDLSPYKGTMVMLDKELTIHKSFLALANNNPGVGLIWDGPERQVKGLLTNTDFLILLYHTKLAEDQSVHTQKLKWWLRERKMGCSVHGKECMVIKPKPLASIDSNVKVVEAAKLILNNHIHRLVVYEEDTNEPLFLLGLRRILQTVQRQLRSMPLTPWMLFSAQEAQIGQWKDVKTVNMGSVLSDAIELLLTSGISSLPVVDEAGRFMDNLTKSDILNFLSSLPTETSTEAYKQLLDRTVEEALRARKLGSRSRQAYCSVRDTLVTVIDALVSKDLRSIFALDDERVVRASLSVSDVMRHIVSR